MKPKAIWLLAPLILAGVMCGTGAVMDYGQPAAQFFAADLVSRGEAFLGKKVTVKGAVVTELRLEDPHSAWVLLEGDVLCHFEGFRAMAESCEVGMVVVVDGMLKRCEDGGALLDPAMLRDPAAPFSPTRPE